MRVSEFSAQIGRADITDQKRSALVREYIGRPRRGAWGLYLYEIIRSCIRHDSAPSIALFLKEPHGQSTQFLLRYAAEAGSPKIVRLLLDAARVDIHPTQVVRLYSMGNLECARHLAGSLYGHASTILRGSACELKYCHITFRRAMFTFLLACKRRGLPMCRDIRRLVVETCMGMYLREKWKTAGVSLHKKRKLL